MKSEINKLLERAESLIEETIDIYKQAMELAKDTKKRKYVFSRMNNKLREIRQQIRSMI